MSSAMKRRALRAFASLPPSSRRFIVRRVMPSFTVGTMCVVRREDDGSVLLLQHEYRGAWGLPGGLLERGETIEECARREVLEETGLEVQMLGPPTVNVEPEVRRVDVIFHCRPIRVDVDTEQTAEVNCAEWHQLDDLPVLQEPVAEGIRRLAEADDVIREALKGSPLA